MVAKIAKGNILKTTDLILMILFFCFNSFLLFYYIYGNH